MMFLKDRPLLSSIAFMNRDRKFFSLKIPPVVELSGIRVIYPVWIQPRDDIIMATGKNYSMQLFLRMNF